MTTPIRIHPDNPKLFEYQGKPLALLTATEHYGAVMNRPFDWEAYLDDAADKGMTITRLFTLFRELQSQVNPYSTCKPESPDYIAPFLRTGPGNAMDGQPRYDLNQWNPEFFARLHAFLGRAEELGIIVEVVFLSNTYGPDVWRLNPLHANNNVNGLPHIEWWDYNTQRHMAIYERQVAHVKKIVEETNRYGNIIYEICNEPGGNLCAPGSPPSSETDEWLNALIEVVREAEKELPQKHLIAGQQAFAYRLDADDAHGLDVYQFAEASFDTMDYDVVNMHPLSNMRYRGAHYNMGPFMQGRLALRAVRDYCLDTHGEAKPLNLDEDNAASQFKDVRGWTVHRKRAWTTLLCGAHYDVIDFSIINYCPTGTPESRAGIRSWMKHLSTFIHGIDLVRACPLRDALLEQPRHTCESVLAVEGKDYAIYLADDRETDEPCAGEPIAGDVVIPLPQGDYLCALYSPASGLYSPWIPLKGGEARITLPPFEQDVVIRIQARSGD